MGRFSIILVVGFAIIAGGLKLNHGRLGRQAQEVSTDQFLEASARNVTNSVVNLGLYELSQSFGWRSGYSGLSIQNGTGDLTIDDETSDSTLGWNQVRITATGTYSGESTTSIVTLRQRPWSEFAYFTDNEPPIFFITGDTIRGPIHTNGQFHIAGDPVFFGLVSSAGSGWVGWGNPEFKAGTNFGCDPITLPVDMSIIQGKAQEGGVLFLGETYIDFLSDGTFDWEVVNGAVVDSSGNVDISTINGVIATTNSADIHVQGVLDGRITILSDANIWIEDDIVYAVDPRVDPTSDDILGMISTKDIIVADNAANQNDCVVQATLMALDKSFMAENPSSGAPRGTLTVLGGIIQKMRGPVGTAVSGLLHSGYSKCYTFDARFLTDAPPFYPILRELSITSWYE